ncbi:MAG TPA: glycosyltransferase family 4 protein [Mycobacteriales bacterium]|nr:glycosyltransferase family 4 protein [Mycobacteriales bacterium]
MARDVDVHVVLGEDGPLVARLRGAGIEVEVMPLADAARDTRKDTVTATGVPLGAARATSAYVLALRRRIRELRPDIVHTNSLKSAVYGGLAGRATGVPVLWHIRDRIATDYLPAAAVRMIRGAAGVLPTAVVTPSRTTMDTMPGRRPVIRAVVPDSVELPSVDVTDADSDASAPRPFRVGMVGRLAEWKGQHIAIDAFARAFPDGDAQLWLVGEAMFGESTYVDRLRRQIEALGLGDRIELRGFRDDVWSELAQLDVLVHASISPEPFGQVVLEGMAYGLPVIAAAPGGPAEIMVDQVDGLLVPAGSVDALAEALRRLASDAGLRARLGQSARITAAQYTPVRTAAGLLSVYRRMVD